MLNYSRWLKKQFVHLKRWKIQKKTKEERTKASDAVEDVYVYNRETGQNRVALIQSLFAYVNEVNAEAQEKDTKNKEKAKKENKPAPAPTSTEDKLKKLKKTNYLVTYLKK